MKKYTKNKYFCGIVRPSEKDNILEYNQYIKCHTLFILTLSL